MSTKEVSDRVDPVITTREQLIAPMAGAKSRASAGASGPSTKSWSIAPPTTAPLPMMSPMASATCWSRWAVRLGADHEGGNVIA
jgi:hypothetical protein